MLRFFHFLTGMLAGKGYDRDDFIARLLDTHPAAVGVVPDIVTDGLPLGQKTTAALVWMATDWREEDLTRVSAATAVGGLDADANIALLLRRRGAKCPLRINRAAPGSWRPWLAREP
jgi:hypothetical protein